MKSYYDEWASSYDMDVKKLNYTLPAETSNFAEQVASDQDKLTWTFCDLGAGIYIGLQSPILSLFLDEFFIFIIFC